MKSKRQGGFIIKKSNTYVTLKRNERQKYPVITTLPSYSRTRQQYSQGSLTSNLEQQKCTSYKLVKNMNINDIPLCTSTWLIRGPTMFRWVIIKEKTWPFCLFYSTSILSFRNNQVRFMAVFLHTQPIYQNLSNDDDS